MVATSPNNILEEDKKIILVNCIEINIPRICDENQTTGQFNVSQLLLNPIDTVTTQKMKFSIKDFFSKCDQILNGKLHFFCAVCTILYLHWIIQKSVLQKI